MKSPVVHFLLLGVLLLVSGRLFVAWQEDVPRPHAQDHRIVVSKSQVEALVRQYEVNAQMPPTDAVRAELIARFAEEEMLFREARHWGLTDDNQAIDLRLRQKMAFVADEELSDEELDRQARALGLEPHDAVVRNMLAHNMRLLLSRKGETEPTDAEVEAFYAKERVRFARPARMTGSHVFFSTATRGAMTGKAARDVKARLGAGALALKDAVEAGDVSPFGSHFRGLLGRQLATRFGVQFALVAEALAENQWSDPVQTPFGTHLLWIEERTSPTAPPLSEIRVRVVEATKSAQREHRLADAMDALRARYEVVVE